MKITIIENGEGMGIELEGDVTPTQAIDMLDRAKFAVMDEYNKLPEPDEE